MSHCGNTPAPPVTKRKERESAACPPESRCSNPREFTQQMDPLTKTGKVYLRPHKPGKKWKAVLLSLVPHSRSGVGRLEIQDLGGSTAAGDHVIRRHHQPHSDRKLKVVRLSEVISVLRLPPNAEACPMENTSAFCVETPDRTIVFAALKDDCVDWVEKLRHSTFQRCDPSGSNELLMEDNQIYVSADEAPEFWVVVQRTEAAARFGLQGSYWLQVGGEALLLREPQKKNFVTMWPYELLRRYGKDKLAFTIEAGRRCKSGPGSFTFETLQAERIFSLIQTTIKQKTSTVTVSRQDQDAETVGTTNAQAHSPLPRIPAGTSMAAALEDKLRIQEMNAAAAEEGAQHQDDLIGSAECASVQPAPVTFMPLPLVPTHESHAGGHPGDQSEAIYAEPNDCIQFAQKPQPVTALYVDPASVLPLQPPGSKQGASPSPQEPHLCLSTDPPESVYSEVYDRIRPVQTEQTATCFADDEPIYAEPMSKEEEESHKHESKPDPFAHLYAQVCKTASSSPSSSPSSSSLPAGVNKTATTDQYLDDVIYENLGII